MIEDCHESKQQNGKMGKKQENSRTKSSSQIIIIKRGIRRFTNGNCHNCCWTWSTYTWGNCMQANEWNSACEMFIQKHLEHWRQASSTISTLQPLKAERSLNHGCLPVRHGNIIKIACTPPTSQAMTLAASREWRLMRGSDFRNERKTRASFCKRIEGYFWSQIWGLGSSWNTRTCNRRVVVVQGWLAQDVNTRLIVGLRHSSRHTSTTPPAQPIST